MQRHATAIWNGGLKDGSGTISAESRAFSALPYDFRKRFENEPGTNPEELIAAAHAACFSMALSAELGKAKLTPASIRTRAAVNLEMLPTGPTVTAIHLDVTARVPGADRAAFERAAGDAKAGCPISRLLAAAKITMEAKLE
ncbi:MAG TPA: OsmC family protein [Terriglobales bacterium]|nr:OsmC family protein [Terriglobales bacterium]